MDDFSCKIFMQDFLCKIFTVIRDFLCKIFTVIRDFSCEIFIRDIFMHDFSCKILFECFLQEIWDFLQDFIRALMPRLSTMAATDRGFLSRGPQQRGNLVQVEWKSPYISPYNTTNSVYYMEIQEKSRNPVQNFTLLLAP